MEHVHDRSHQSDYAFCPYDGCDMQWQREPDGRQLPKCSRCGFTDYGNPKPCVAVLIVQQCRLMLARRGIEPAKGMWDIPGGFIDAGETAEQAVVREMLEETGLDVRVTQYLGSLPDVYGNRSTPTLNICFIAEPIGGTLTAQDDVVELGWFLPTELPRTMAFAHQSLILQKWLDAEKPT